MLDDIYQYQLPASRRVPPLLWTRVRADLPGYLSNSEADGVILINWYHRQFRWGSRDIKECYESLKSAISQFTQLSLRVWKSQTLDLYFWIFFSERKFIKPKLFNLVQGGRQAALPVGRETVCLLPQHHVRILPGHLRRGETQTIQVHGNTEAQVTIHTSTLLLR